MEVPEFFVSGYFGVGAARDFLMEKRHSEQKPGKHFAIDDLLDFSNDDVIQVTDCFFVDNVAGNSTDSSTVTVVDSCNSISGGEKHFACNRSFSDSQLSGELCIPYDDLVELEWLSNYVDDSFSVEKNFVGVLVCFLKKKKVVAVY